MNGKNRVILSAVVAALIATALVGAFLYTQNVLPENSNTSQSVQTGNNSGQSSNGPKGTLAVLMTDPPTIPEGVTAVYINYSDVLVHFRNAGNQSGWTNLQAAGEINLLSIVNSTQTIATANISNGVFNAIKFNITSAVVTFQGQNYTADLVYQQHYLLVAIPGGITVTSGQTAGAVIDMTPTILLLGNTTNPTFAFLPVAKGYTLPANSVSIHPHVGDRNDYNGQIWTQIHDMTHFQITGAGLTPSSVTITVENTGTATVVFRFLALTSTTSVSGGWIPSTSFGSVSKISEFFIVAPNGSLMPVTDGTYQGMVHTLSQAGYALASHQSATFTYTGPVTIGALILLQGHTPTQSINNGQNYVLTITGSGLYAQTAVTAGSTTTISTTTSSSSISSSSATSSTTSSSSTTTSSSSTTSTSTTSSSSSTTTSSTTSSSSTATGSTSSSATSSSTTSPSTSTTTSSTTATSSTATSTSTSAA